MRLGYILMSLRKRHSLKFGCFPARMPQQKWCVDEQSENRWLPLLLVRDAATILLTEQKTITAEWYCIVCVTEVFQNVCEQSPKLGHRGASR